MTDAALIERLINVNRHRLVPAASPLPTIVDIKVGKKRHTREDISHQPVTVVCDVAGETSCFDLWVKYRPGIHEIFGLLDGVYNRVGDGVFPRPILEWHSNNGDCSLLLMTRVQGGSLRNRLLRAALLRRTRPLECIFESNGIKMRKFHDASEVSGSLSAGEFVQQAQTLVERTGFFAPAEKTTVLQHIDRYAATLRTRELPLRMIHHDWTLRNVLVDRTGADYLVDFDSLRAPVSSRWIEVVCLMLNLESQSKWSPLITIGMLSGLWQSFWRGYASDRPPECSIDDVPALLFLTRIFHLLGGTFRVPLFRKHYRFVDRRFIRAVKSSVLRGEHTLLAWHPSR
jgi:hypothetical protein